MEISLIVLSDSSNTGMPRRTDPTPDFETSGFSCVMVSDTDLGNLRSGKIFVVTGSEITPRASKCSIQMFSVPKAPL